MNQAPAFIAFADTTRLAAGSLADVAVAVHEQRDRTGDARIHVFDCASGRVVDLDLSGDEKNIRARYASSTEPLNEALRPLPRGPGRPRLGVVAREVTLLPRHWDWLGDQPGGASVALRKLVDEARRTNRQSDVLRAHQNAAYRFMSALAGDWPNFEESTRALFAGDRFRFGELTEGWPRDVRDHLRQLASAAFACGTTDVCGADGMA